MKKLLAIFRQKSTWAGVSAIGAGAVLLLNGDTASGVQTIIGGFAVIFMRQAIEKSGPAK